MKHKSLRFPAPAKLNLFLHVTGKRSDGYHNLQTLFQLIDYADEIEFTPRNDNRIVLRCNLPSLPTERNLIVRAAEALQALCAGACAAQGIEIYLHKRIPPGMGLGGGSSDAATTLKVLNQMWACGLSQQQLMGLGRKLGADVPIFLYGRTAWGEGRGDKLTAVFLHKACYIVLLPPIQVSTAEAFSEFDSNCCRRDITMDDYQAGAGMNVFAPVMRLKYSEIDQAMTWLEQHAAAKLSGTGAAVFAEFPDMQSAQEVFSQKPEEFIGFVAEGTPQSDLETHLQRAFCSNDDIDT